MAVSHWSPRGCPADALRPWAYGDGDQVRAWLQPLEAGRWLVGLTARRDRGGSIVYEGTEAQAQGFAEHLLAWYEREGA